MALINFSSPDYKDKTVYAVAGSHTETVLKIAKTNNIPINFECENSSRSGCNLGIDVAGFGGDIANTIVE